MGKEIQVSFGDFYYEKFSRPIRNKKDFIFLILDTMNVLDLGKIGDRERGKIIIKIDKMSRIFYHLDDKYYSVVFPFSLEEREGVEGEYIIYDPILDIEINNRIISLIRGIIEKIDIDNSTIEELLEQIYFDSMDEGYSSKDVKNCWSIISRLFSVEAGYIRYDYDLIHQNGNFHPLNHLDINYSTRSTYKLGLQKRIELGEFVDLLDIQKECKYIV